MKTVFAHLLFLVLSVTIASEVYSQPRLLIDQNEKPEKVVSGLKFTEGPIWTSEGRLQFTDLEADSIYEMGPGNKLRLLRRPSHFANGLALDRDGATLIAEHATRRIVKQSPGGELVTLADNFQGIALNSPNDLVVRNNDGAIFFTDPPFGLMKPWGPENKKQDLPHQGVYRIDRLTGKVMLESAALTYPNGLALSRDEKHLYVGDSFTSEIFRFDVAQNGALSGKKLFIDLKVQNPKGLPFGFSGYRNPVDGMRFDQDGNLWTTGPGGVVVIDAEAKIIQQIKIPDQTTNLAWGGPNRDVLFITAKGGVWRLRTKVRGHN
jgi:gluconolactonase